MTVLVGGTLVLLDRVLEGGRLAIEDGRIAAIEPAGPGSGGPGAIDVSGAYVVPGFIDVHVHGVAGHDVLDAGHAVMAVARELPRYGVTAFCPTSIACPPSVLRQFLTEVGQVRRAGVGGARVLPAHLESNFINPDYRGAQPASCLRLPPFGPPADRELEYSGQDVLDAIVAGAGDVGIVTIAPELPGGLDLVRWLKARGHHVSIGHTGADFEQALEAFDAGVTQATHLFNRMPPLGHRAPGAAGAVLTREDVVAELVCDGHHVHPAVGRMAMQAKGPLGVMAITDGTAGSGLAVGARTRLGGRPILVGDHAALLDDGTLAGSTLTMDRAFRTIVRRFGGSVVDAAAMCATAPARALGLVGTGVLAESAAADLVVLDRDFRVLRTFVDGREVFNAA